MGYWVIKQQTQNPVPKPLKWIGSAKEELTQFPDEVTKEMGHALHLAQIHMKAPNAKPLKGFGGAGVLEVVANHEGNTCRAVYTVKFQGIIFVLHAFQKKSKKGIETPKANTALIKARLKAASDYYDEHCRSKKP
jgi:phage-related protein